MTNDLKSRVAAQEQQVDRALVELRRLIYQLLSEAAGTGGDSQAQITNLKQRLHAMELRALENERKATTAQKRLVELQGNLEETEMMLGEAKDRVISTEAKAVELEAQLDEAESR